MGWNPLEYVNGWPVAVYWSDIFSTFYFIYIFFLSIYSFLEAFILQQQQQQQQHFYYRFSFSEISFIFFLFYIDRPILPSTLIDSSTFSLLWRLDLCVRACVRAHVWFISSDHHFAIAISQHLIHQITLFKPVYNRSLGPNRNQIPYGNTQL